MERPLGLEPAAAAAQHVPLGARPGPFLLLFTGAGSLALLQLALPGHHNRPLSLAAGLGAWVVAGVFAACRRPPTWLYELALAVGALVAYSAGQAAGTIATASATLYFWLAAFGFYYLYAGAAARQALVLAISCAALLVGHAASLGEAATVNGGFVAATLIGAGALLGRLGRERMERVRGELTQAVRTDLVTDLHNRRSFQEVLHAELERARRTHRGFAVVVADVDAFRRMNDVLGQPAGDLGLEFLGAIIRRSKRSIDLAARIGDDEFAVLLPESDEHGAFRVAERIRDDVRASFADEPVPLTLSLGVAAWPRHGATARDLLAACQQALGLARELGRDRTAIYSEHVLTALAQTTARRDHHRHLATLMALAEAVDLRDSGTAEHSQTVGRYAAALARELGLSGDEVARVRQAGVLHDVGKVGISDAVLRKPGPLDELEWAEMRKHPVLGAQILDDPAFADLRAWVLAHHERPDGRGYPQGIPAGTLPLEARILSVADAYEAMTADRVYRKALPSEDALARLKAGAGTQWDEGVVGALVGLVERGDPLVAPGSDAVAGIEAAQRGLDALPERGTMRVVGTIAGRPVEVLWEDGEVTSDPLILDLIERLRERLGSDLRQRWGFLLAVGAVLDQGSLDAHGDVPAAETLDAAPLRRAAMAAGWSAPGRA